MRQLAIKGHSPTAVYPEGRQNMRYVDAALIGLFSVVVVLFSLQNLGNVTISFLTMGATLPLAVLVIGVYILGMVTGGFVQALLRSWIHGARRK